MLDRTGHPVTIGAALSRVQRSGGEEFTLANDDPPVTELRRLLRRGARALNMRISVRTITGGLLVFDPDHEVDPERLRAAVNALSEHLPHPLTSSQGPPEGFVFDERSDVDESTVVLPSGHALTPDMVDAIVNKTRAATAPDTQPS